MIIQISTWRDNIIVIYELKLFLRKKKQIFMLGAFYFIVSIQLCNQAIEKKRKTQTKRSQMVNLIFQLLIGENKLDK